MKSDRVAVNFHIVNISQFDSIDEALATLPKELVLNYINMCWRNTQMVKITDAVREASFKFDQRTKSGFRKTAK